jgi:hypothetical protein
MGNLGARKRNPKVMNIIQASQCSTVCHVVIILSRVCSQNGGQIEETAETEEELYKKTRSKEEVRIGMDPLRGVCLTGKKSGVSVLTDSSSVQLYSMCIQKKLVYCVSPASSCGIMCSRDLPPPPPSAPAPPSQATGDLVYLQLPRRTNLDRFMSGPIRNLWLQNSVCEYCSLFLIQ